MIRGLLGLLTVIALLMLAGCGSSQKQTHRGHGQRQDVGVTQQGASPSAIPDVGVAQQGSSHTTIGDAGVTQPRKPETTMSEASKERCLGNDLRSRQSSVVGRVANGKIAFVWEPIAGRGTSTSDIHLIDPDGTDETRLTDGPTNEWSPVWSPSGNQIAFVGSDSSSLRYYIYVMNADGSCQPSLTDRPESGGGVIWSPDGENIAFPTGFSSSGIYVVDADGTNETRLAKTDPAPSQTAPQSAPASYQTTYRGSVTWSPGGEKIAFASATTTTTESGGSAGAENAQASSAAPGEGAGIFVVDADGTGLRTLTRTTYKDMNPIGFPAWSPTGEKLAFYDYPTEGSEYGAIYVINADGTGRKKLSGTHPTQPPFAWSPDGKRIAFTKQWDSTHSDLYVIDADGTGLRRLTDTRGQEASPIWSPDGEKIALMSTSEGELRAELYVIDADGTDRTRLADDVSNEHYGYSLSWGRR